MVKYNGCSVWPEDRKPCISLTLGNRGRGRETPPVGQQSAQQPEEMGVKHFSKLFSQVRYFFVVSILILRSVCDIICTRTLREQQWFWLHANVQRMDQRIVKKITALMNLCAR